MSPVILLEVLYICALCGAVHMRSSATLRISYLLCLEADIAVDYIRPTFEKLIDAHPSFPTRALCIY